MTVPYIPFPQKPRQVNEGRVQKACGDVNHVAGNCDGNERACVKDAGKGKDVENRDVNRLAQQCGSVVAQPQKGALVSAKLFGKGPPLFVEVDVQEFACGKADKACGDDARSVGEEVLQVLKGKVVGRRRVKAPYRGKENKGGAGRDSQEDSPACLLLSVELAQKVGGQKGRRKERVSQRLLHSKGVHQNGNFDISENRAHRDPGKNSALSKKAEHHKQAAEREQERRDQKNFVSHF